MQTTSAHVKRGCEQKCLQLDRNVANMKARHMIKYGMKAISDSAPNRNCRERPSAKCRPARSRGAEQYRASEHASAPSPVSGLQSAVCSLHQHDRPTPKDAYLTTQRTHGTTHYSVCTLHRGTTPFILHVADVFCLCASCLLLKTGYRYALATLGPFESHNTIRSRV